MREILFKAKRHDNGEWVEGSYVYRPSTMMIHSIVDENGDVFSINRETLCQFADLMDKNGNKIFEGDLITACSYSYHEPVDDFSGEVILGGSNGISLMALEEERQGTRDDFIELSYIWAEYKVEYEIFGNIHDKG